MKTSVASALLLSLLFPFFSFAANPHSCAQALLGIHGLVEKTLAAANKEYPYTENILKNFLELSRIFRASHHEGEVREFLAGEAKRLGLSYEVDKAGNLLVRIPARNSTQIEAVALHSHLDMVPNVKGVKTLAEAEEFLRNNRGVLPFEFVDGNIQSVGQRNTIGADNGSGVAIMMEYMRNPNLTHPPIELIFTVQEEVGLLGSEKLELPLTAKKVLSLDAGRGNEALVGSQGSARFGLSQGDIGANAPVNPAHHIFHFEISGFKGGHSGIDIGRGGANGVREMALFLNMLKESFPESDVLSLKAGIQNLYNAIPKNFTLEVSMEPQRAAELSALIREYREHIESDYKDVEKAESLQIKFQQRSVSTSDYKVSWDYLTALLSFIQQTPNGLKNSTWPTRITDNMFSSNLSFLILDSKGLEAGMMPRFYQANNFPLFQQIVEGNLQALLPEVKMNPHAISSPWTATGQSAFQSLVLTQAQAMGLQLNPIVAKGSVEASSLARLYPGMDIIVIGVEIQGEHNPDERMDLSSLAQISRLVDESLKAIASGH